MFKSFCNVVPDHITYFTMSYQVSISVKSTFELYVLYFIGIAVQIYIHIILLLYFRQ